MAPNNTLFLTLQKLFFWTFEISALMVNDFVLPPYPCQDGFRRPKSDLQTTLPLGLGPVTIPFPGGRSKEGWQCHHHVKDSFESSGKGGSIPKGAAMYKQVQVRF